MARGFPDMYARYSKLAFATAAFLRALASGPMYWARALSCPTMGVMSYTGGGATGMGWNSGIWILCEGKDCSVSNDILRVSRVEPTAVTVSTGAKVWVFHLVVVIVLGNETGEAS